MPKASPAPTVAFVTTCKGRLHHLRETLPLMAAQAPDELIVVDYGCPDATGDWVEAEFPQAKVVRVGDAEGFNVSRARNLGAAAAASEWLFFIDADIRAKPTLLKSLRAGLVPGHFYKPAAPEGSEDNSSEVFGSFACRAADFAAVGGYDEVIEGWGREDKDLYMRLRLHGVTGGSYASTLLEAIAHDDAQRTILPGMRDRWHNEAVNACYALAKQRISLIRGGRGDLPLDRRRGLIDHCRNAVSRWYRGDRQAPLPIQFVVDRSPQLWLASRIKIHSEIAVTVTLERAQATD